MIADSEIQRIALLTPLADVLASFDLSVRQVAPREEALTKAVGLTLAADVVIAAGHPKAALALRDGYAVRSGVISPAPRRIDIGEPLPADADAVIALDAVHMRGAPGEGVLPPDTDTTAGLKLQLTGARLRRIDVALMIALGIERVIVREPRVRVVCTGQGDIMRGASALIASAIGVESGIAITGEGMLEAALNDENVDAVVAIGGTGSGRNDTSVRTLARIGRVEFHGIGITPGETTALGFAGVRPVLLLPGRIDAALAAWLTIGRRLLARLAFRLIEEQPFAAELARKISSPLGLAEVIPVRRRLGRVEPLASGYLSMQALARAEGWVLVPADSEGYPAGARVVVRPWP